VPHPHARTTPPAVAVPDHVLRQEDVEAHLEAFFPGKNPVALARLLSVFGNTGIKTRYSCVPPEWYEHPHGWAEKNRLYLEHATGLLERAAREAVERASLDLSQIDAVVAVSSTGIATPSLDALLIERLGLRRETRRLPLFGLGCAGGVIGLARAADMARLEPGSKVLLLVVELCGLTFRRRDISKSNVIAAALFGDGAAATVVSTTGEGVLELGPSGEHTWPGSLDVMGWTVEEDGLGVIFSRDIPTLTRTDFAKAVRAFLARHDLTLADVDHFACHPGGAKVLDALEDVFDLPRGGLVAPRRVIRDFGNMSAVTVLFVLRELLATGATGRFLLSTLGPGFTAAFLTASSR